MLRAHVTVYQPMSHSFSLIDLSKAFFFLSCSLPLPARWLSSELASKISVIYPSYDKTL